MIDFFKSGSSCNHISVSRFKCSYYSKYHPDGPSMLEFRAEQRKDIVDAIYHVRQKLQERAKRGKERFDFKVSHESVLKKRIPGHKYVGGHHKKDYSHARLIEQKRNFTAMESSRCDDDYCDQESRRYSRHDNNLKSFNHHEKRYDRCEDNKRSKHESRLHKSESIS